MSELNWRRSTRCDTGSCAEVASDGTDVLVRNSSGGEPVRFTANEWRAFVAGAKAGEFDPEVLGAAP